MTLLEAPLERACHALPVAFLIGLDLAVRGQDLGEPVFSQACSLSKGLYGRYIGGQNGRSR